MLLDSERRWYLQSKQKLTRSLQNAFRNEGIFVFCKEWWTVFRCPGVFSSIFEYFLDSVKLNWQYFLQFLSILEYFLDTFGHFWTLFGERSEKTPFYLHENRIRL